MSKVSGLGGFIVDADSLAVTHNSYFEIETQGENDDVSDSGTGAWRQKLGIIKSFSGMMRIFENDAAYPEALGLTENEIRSLGFKRGESDVYDGVTDTLITSVRAVNDQFKARGYEIRFEGGTFERDVIIGA